MRIRTPSIRLMGEISGICVYAVAPCAPSSRRTIHYPGRLEAQGNYSCLDLEPLRTAGFQLMQRMLGGKRSKKALHQIAMEADTLKDFLDRRISQPNHFCTMAGM